MRKTRSTSLLDVFRGSSIDTLPPEPIEQGDFIKFTHDDKDGTRLMASGYVSSVTIDGTMVDVVFNDRHWSVPSDNCEIVCKQFRLPGT